MAKRALNDEEMTAAHALADAIQRSGKSQEQVGAETGVSQGQVWQWLSGKLPVPAKRAVALAAAVNVTPELISPAWKAAVAGSQSAPSKQDATFVSVGGPSPPEANDVEVRFFPNRRAKAGTGYSNTEPDRKPLGLKFRAESLRRRGINLGIDQDGFRVVGEVSWRAGWI